MTEHNASQFTKPENVQEYKSGDGWPEPNMAIINAGVREAPDLPTEHFSPLPAAVDNLKGAAACIIEEARRRSCPPDYVAGAMLGVAAALIGNSRRAFAYGTWREPCALNVGLVGKPSAKKSPAMDAVVDHLAPFERLLEADHRIELRNYERDLAESKAAREEWQKNIKIAQENKTPAPDMPEAAEEPIKPCCPYITASDATVPAMADVCEASKKGVLLKRDELAGWLLGLGNFGSDGDRAFYLECYGGRSYSIDRKKNNGRRIIIERLLISILGGIQPDKLASALLAGDDDGLCSRFLYFWPDPVPYMAPGDADGDTGLARALERLNGLQLRDLGDKQFEPVNLRLDDSARERFEEWCGDITSRGNHADGLMAGFMGKATGGVLRIAMILEHLDWAFGPEHDGAPNSISYQTINRAMMLYDEYLIPMAERAFGDASRPEDERRAATFAKAILERREDLIFAREVQRKWNLSDLDRAAKIKSAGHVLEEMDWLQDVSERADGKSGRPATIWRVNPKLLEVRK